MVRLLPLKAFLLLSLLADLRELSFIVLPCSALLGFTSGVVLHSLYLLLPCFHQLVIALADLLLLWTNHRQIHDYQERACISEVGIKRTTCQYSKLEESTRKIVLDLVKVLTLRPTWLINLLTALLIKMTLILCCNILNTLQVKKKNPFTNTRLTIATF